MISMDRTHYFTIDKDTAKKLGGVVIYDENHKDGGFGRLKIKMLGNSAGGQIGYKIGNYADFEEKKFTRFKDIDASEVDKYIYFIDDIRFDISLEQVLEAVAAKYPTEELKEKKEHKIQYIKEEYEDIANRYGKKDALFELQYYLELPRCAVFELKDIKTEKDIFDKLKEKYGIECKEYTLIRGEDDYGRYKSEIIKYEDVIAKENAIDEKEDEFER